jgi:hypothetical protein
MIKIVAAFVAGVICGAIGIWVYFIHLLGQGWR